MKYFGSSGIRGIVNRDITPDFVLRVGQAVGTLNSSVVVGWDPRVSHPMLYNALVAGLHSTGCSVATAGMLPTPTLAYAARKFDCGVMLTASHNPAEYNGVKLWNPDGTAYDTLQQGKIEELIDSAEFRRATWRDTGWRVDVLDAVQEHVEHILGHTSSSSLSVVVDCGCGAASVITPYLLREMGCRVFTLNSQPDGHFPARNPEPVEENLEQLKRSVKTLGADLGIAHDGDADRMMAVDNLGRFVSGDKLLALFGRSEAKKSMVAPVDTSLAVEDAIKPAVLIYSRVGDVYVAEAMKRHGCEFGGEASGSWIFPRISYCPDGIYAAAHLVELLTEHGGFDGLLEEIPTYPTLRGSLRCGNPAGCMECVRRRVEEWFSGFDVVGMSTLDGVRISMSGGWVLIRPSGTEPKIRITVEARSLEPGELYQRAEALVRECIRT